MKIIKWFLGTVLVLLVLIIAALYIFNYDYLLKAVRTIYFKGHTTAFLEDYKSFDNVVVEAGTAIPWSIHKDYNKDYNKVKPTDRLIDTHTASGTVAYLIIKNDSIWHEAYYDGFDKNSKSNSFSMAKSFISGLLGKAIMDGHIENLNQPVSDFYPRFSDGNAANVTVGDLSSMTSGMDWDESYYSPFSITTKAYFYHDLEEMMLDVNITEKPAQGYKYLSGNTQLLAMVIEKASGKKTADYFSEAFWKPLGAENDALWQVDSEENEMVKAYCCFASNARDFARFGKLYKDHGRFNGQQILDSAFVAKSIKPRFEGEPYGYGFWLADFQRKHAFVMRGHLGQYVIVVPEDNVIIVRLGHTKGTREASETYPANFWIYLEEAYEMLN